MGLTGIVLQLKKRRVDMVFETLKEEALSSSESEVLAAYRQLPHMKQFVILKVLALMNREKIQLEDALLQIDSTSYRQFIVGQSRLMQS